MQHDLIASVAVRMVNAAIVFEHPECESEINTVSAAGTSLDLLVDWVHQQSGGSVSTCVDVSPFAEQHGLETLAALQLVRQGARTGLLKVASTMGGAAAFLTLDGLQDVAARKRRRDDPSMRAQAARDAVLRWFYDQHQAGVNMAFTEKVLTTDHATFEGDRFTNDEIDRAAGYLADRGLVKGVSASGRRGPLRANITAEGIDCVEQYGGHVPDYLRRSQPAPSASINIGTLNNSGALAMGNSGDTTQHIAAGVNLTDLGAFAQLLLQELPNLRLDAEQETAVRTDLEEVQREATAEKPVRERVVAAFGRTVGVLVDAGKPVMTSLMLMLARHYAGLPPA